MQDSLRFIVYVHCRIVPVGSKGREFGPYLSGPFRSPTQVVYCQGLHRWQARAGFPGMGRRRTFAFVLGLLGSGLDTKRRHRRSIITKKGLSHPCSGSCPRGSRRPVSGLHAQARSRAGTGATASATGDLGKLIHEGHEEARRRLRGPSRSSWKVFTQSDISCSGGFMPPRAGWRDKPAATSDATFSK